MYGTLGAMGGDTVGPGAPRTVRVASYNIHHGARADDVLDLEGTARTLGGLGADVIGLQEVDRHLGERSGCVDQAGRLADRLGMHAAFGANVVSAPACAGGMEAMYGTAILSRYPILEWCNTPLPTAADAEPRGLLEVVVRLGSRTVRFANAHLQHDDAAARRCQAGVILSRLAGRPLPTVLTGDLNATPDAPEIADLTAVLADTWAAAGAGRGSTFPAGGPDRRIDYVLASSEWSVLAATVVPSAASDHLPYVATVRLES